MDAFELVIHKGTLVTAGDTVVADLAIRNGVIVAVGHDLKGCKTVDATGLLVLPGVVDPHVHLQMPAGATTSSDDWYTGTLAAAYGGTTTVIGFVEPEPGELLLEAFDRRRAQAESKAVIDYGLHMTLLAADAGTLAQIPAVVVAGMSSFKTYPTYGNFRLDDSQFLSIMAAVRDAGGMVIAQAENDAMTQWCAHALLEAGEVGPAAYPKSHPAAAEAEAITRVLALAEVAGAMVYIMPISTGRGVAALARAQLRGQRALGETCPQYLLLTDKEFARPGFEGAKFVCSPPLRKAEDNAALWSALSQGTLHTVGTAHRPFYYHGQKDWGREGFTAIPEGLPGVEARLALLYTFGVRAGRLSLNRWVDVCSTAPARLFGLYPHKGTLCPGADADIVLFDPEKRVTLSRGILHENVDYTPYEGLELQGYPVKVFSRGQLLVQDGEFVGRQGHGTYCVRDRLV